MEENKFTDDVYDHIAFNIDELLKDTDIFQVVRWEEEGTNIYQLLDSEGNELYLVEFRKEEEQ